MRVLRAILVVSLVLLLWGIVMEPAWWYRLIFEGQYASASYWAVGTYYALLKYLANSLWILAAVWALLALSHTAVPNRLRDMTVTVWNKYVVGEKARVSSAIVLVLIAAGVAALEIRSRSERERDRLIQDSLRKSEENLKDAQRWQQDAVGKPPLSEPTTFLYLDTAEVEALYGQSEPDLIPAVIISELKNSNELKGELSLEEFLKTSVGKTTYERTVTEYRKIDKNPQRKLHDLLQFLYETKKLKRYGQSELNSEELRKLEEASSLFARYDLLPDPTRLKALRDRLLADRLRSLDGELASLRGLVLVEGEWTLVPSGDSYKFRQPFIENVSDPPFCEIRIGKNLISPKNRDIIANLSGSTMRLSVFGNVTTGLSQKSRTIQLSPIAVF